MPSNVTHRFVSPILWKLNQPLYSSAIQHVFAVAVVYTHRSVPPSKGSWHLETLKASNAQKIEATDLRIALPIPQSEIDANPNIQQNPR